MKLGEQETYGNSERVSEILANSGETNYHKQILRNLVGNVTRSGNEVSSVVKKSLRKAIYRREGVWSPCDFKMCNTHEYFED